MSQVTSAWKSQAGYVWSLIGSAVGFANILSFSAQAYKNGGGAFLIPYVIALLVLGIPMLCLEGMIGYRWKLPLVGAYAHVWGPIGKWVGWLAVLACVTIGAFYIVLTGYSAAYTFFAATNYIPEDSKTFFTQTFLHSTNSVSEFGNFSIPIFISTLVVVLGSWYVLARQVKDGIEKICSFFMPLLALMMLLFAITVCFLPGGMQGWSYYLTPDFSQLTNASLWRDVFGQLFFSLSLGLGIIVGYSRHTKENINIVRAMFWVAIGDFAVSFIAGFAVFGCLAHMSYTLNIPFDAILTSDSTFEIGFVLFPQIIKTFGPFLSPVIGTLFFFCIFIAGITGVFSIMESIIGNVEVEFKISRTKATAGVACLFIVLSAVFCMGNASHLIDALVPMVIGTNMLMGGLLLIWAFIFNRTYSLISDQAIPLIFVWCLRYMAPVILMLILMANLWQEAQDWNSLTFIRWGWLACALGISAGIVSYTSRVQKPFSNYVAS
jgi:neurotransmitter:Na+ symporter, NSS family